MIWLLVALFGAIWAVAASYLAPGLTGFGGPISLRRDALVRPLVEATDRRPRGRGVMAELPAESVRVVKVIHYQSQCPTCSFKGSLYVNRKDAVKYNTCRCEKSR